MKLALSLALACWLVACGGKEKNPACTEIGCQTGLRIALRSQTGLWPAGEYLARVKVDGTTVECKVAIPLPTEPSEGICSRDFVLLELDGAMLPEAQQSIRGVQVLRTAKKVELSIERDGQALAQHSFEPKFFEVQPNGPGCPPICQQAKEAELVLP